MRKNRNNREKAGRTNEGEDKRRARKKEEILISKNSSKIICLHWTLMENLSNRYISCGISEVEAREMVLRVHGISAATPILRLISATSATLAANSFCKSTTSLETPPRPPPLDDIDVNSSTRALRRRIVSSFCLPSVRKLCRERREDKRKGGR